MTALGLAACSSPSAPDAELANDELDDPLPPLNERPDTRSCRLDGTAAGALPRLTAVPLEGITFTDAVQILPAPTNGLWVVEARGRIWSYDPTSDESARLVVDLSDRVDCCASRGLLAADWEAESGLFVHYHRAVEPERTRVARLSFVTSGERSGAVAE